MYDIDFHYYVVYWMSYLALGSPERASHIAWASQFVDDYSPTAPVSIGGGPWEPGLQETLRVFHFPSLSGRPVKRRAPLAEYLAKLAAREPGRPGERDVSLGIALHTLADSFAHENFTWSVSGENERPTKWKWICVPIGHCDAGHAPDDPSSDFSKAADAALEVYGRVRDVPYAEGIAAPIELSGDALTSLRKELEALFVANTGSAATRSERIVAYLRAHGVPVVDYADASRRWSSSIDRFLEGVNRQRDIVGGLLATCNTYRGCGLDD